MEITKQMNGNALTLILTGRLDTATAPQLDGELSSLDANVNSITMDFAQLKYVSSAGLRVLLKTQKMMNAKHGSFIVTKVNQSVMEVFEMTGFADILTIV